jgi:DNA-binding Xre family transcriptional regulator
MTVEERLKELIIEKYGTMKDFTDKIGIPNSTFANILRRGVQNANVLTIIKICQALCISTDDLAEGRIVPTSRIIPQPKRIEDIIFNTKQELLNAEHLTLDDQTISEAEIKSFILSLDMIVELEKKRMMTK